MNGSRETIPPVTVPLFKKPRSENIRPTLSVLIDSIQDLTLCKSHSSDIYFQLPNLIKNKFSQLLTLFRDNQNLTPWFPSIIIGEEYTAAVRIGYGLDGDEKTKDADFEAVRGEFEKNNFISEAEKDGIMVEKIGVSGGLELTLEGIGTISVTDLKNGHQGWLPGYMSSP